MALIDRRLAARAFYAADLLAGRAGGVRCLSCGSRGHTPVVRKSLGLATVFRCHDCELLFRPSGLQSTAIARLYYSRFYTEPGIVNALPEDTSAEAIIAAAHGRKKGRATLVGAHLEALPEARRSVAVFGCSWGYELVILAELGVPIFGIEPGESRRRFGVETLGLNIYPDVAAAAAAGERPGLVISSHVLEHIPELATTLSEISTRLAPDVQLHFTPRVDEVPLSELANVIGREHPLGVTAAFWRRWAERRGLNAEINVADPCPDKGDSELLCVLRQAAR